MADKVEFNVNRFVNGSPEKTDTKLPVIPEVIAPVSMPIEVPNKKKKASKKTDGIDPKAVPTANNSMDYLTHNVPYQQAYTEDEAALDEVIAQVNMLALETMGDMQTIRNSRTIKSKYGLLIGLTENATALINTKMAAIRDKIKIKDTVNNLELKRLKDTKIDAAAQDENVRLQQMYAAFVNAPASVVSGQGGAMSALGPTPMNMMMNSVSPIQQAIIGDETTSSDVDAWQNSLDPSQRRMMLIANGRLDVVVMYDENSGMRRYAAIDKQTGNELQGVELPDPNTAYDLDIHISPSSGNWAKDNRINKIYPVILVGNGSIQQY